MANNQEQIDYWNGQAGEVWADMQDRMDRMLQPLSDIVLQRAHVQPGERVLDVGCGCGATALALHAKGAAVWGVDVSGPMLALARQRAAGRDDIAFSQTDAATQHYSADHQLVFSRFGVMFFADPVSAFANLRSALSADGRLLFACWQAPRNNPWVSVAGRAVQPFLPEPDVPLDPQAPGPFAFADQDYLADILAQAGYSNISIDGVREEMHLADDLDEAVQVQTKIGPLAQVLKELDGEQQQAAIRAARQALAEHMTDSGLRLGAAIWLVSANR